MGTKTLLVLRDRLKTALGDTKLAYADKYTDAISEALREIYPALHKKLDVRTLITGNNLPNSHFEDWAETGYPDFYTMSTITSVEETTIIRGGTKSAKVTRASSDGRMHISEVKYPRLLDLMGKTVSFRCWVQASTASQAYLEIDTKQADGTGQTKTSSAHSGNGEFELIKIDDYGLNDDLVEIKFSFKVTTTAGDVYFDNARVTGKTIYELLLPTDFQLGHVSQVWRQSSSYSDDPCDDLNPQFNDRLFDARVTNQYLRLDSAYAQNYLLKLVGYTPLESLSADTSTITLDDPKVNLLIALAKYKLYQMVEGTPASEDVRRFQSASARAYGEYVRLLPSLRMGRPSETLRI